MSLTDLAPVSGSTSNTIRRSVTLSGRREGHAALAALVDVVFRRLEVYFTNSSSDGVGKIRDRENRLEDGLQALVGPAALGLVDHAGTGRRTPSEPRSGSASPRLPGYCRRTCERACDRSAYWPCGPRSYRTTALLAPRRDRCQTGARAVSRPDRTSEPKLNCHLDAVTGSTGARTTLRPPR